MTAPSMLAVEASASAKASMLEEELTQGGRPPAEVERILFHLSRYCRAAAIGWLLGGADGAVFHARLSRSAQTRRRLLQHTAREHRPFNYFTATGHYGPLCDALAAGADELARDIARLSATEPVKGYEYEEDFYFARFLGLLATREGDVPGQARALLEGLERSLEGEASARLEVGRALVEGDQEHFDAALQALLEERDLHFRSKARSFSSRDEVTETEPHIFVEGLALLRLAQAQGLAVQEEYLFMPSLARVR